MAYYEIFKKKALSSNNILNQKDNQISSHYLRDISKMLKFSEYKFNAVRKILINKNNKSNKRLINLMTV